MWIDYGGESDKKEATPQPATGVKEIPLPQSGSVPGPSKKAVSSRAELDAAFLQFSLLASTTGGTVSKTKKSK